MADGVKVDEGKGPTIAADEVGGQQVQRVKVQHGADGSATDASTASPLPVDDDASQVILSAIKALLEGTAVVKVTDNAGSLTVDGSVAVGSALPPGNNNIGDVDVATLPELPAGTKAIGQVDPRGNVAHDAADSGNPVKTGARARTALPGAVSQDDRVDNVADKFGRQLATVAPLDERVSATLNRINAESGQLFAALAEGAYVVTAISVTNAHASVSTKVEILDGETVKWKGYAVAAGGGFVVSDPNGLFVGSKNTKLNGKCATTGADVDISVSAYKIPA